MRQVLPELLDSLPHNDPAALCSRAELRFINVIMGNHRWLRRLVKRYAKDGERVLELGAGDGEFALQAIRLGVVSPKHWSAIDLAPKPADWPSEATWHQLDMFSLLALPEAEVIVTNLFLHHFEDAQLAELGRRLPDTCRVFIACEPARCCVHSLQGWLLSVLAGFSYVTHHDMLVSIRAGFVGDELSCAMELRGWKTEVSCSLLGAYRLIAWR